MVSPYNTTTWLLQHISLQLSSSNTPGIYDQQWICTVPFLKKRQLPRATDHSSLPEIQTTDNVASENGGEGSVATLDNITSSKCEKSSNSIHFSFALDQPTPQTLECKISEEMCAESNTPGASGSDFERNGFLHKMKVPAKRVKCTSYSQLTLRSYFQKPKQSHVESPDQDDNGANLVKSSLPLVGDCDIPGKGLLHLEDQADESSKTGSRYMALLEWEKIKQKMKTSIPLCKGHGEPCVARSVKKEGPNIGRSFYVCARAQVNHI